MNFADPRYFSGGLSQYQSLRAYWHPVAYISEVREDPFPVTLLNQQIVLGRINERLVALDDRCAHRGAALSSGKIVGDSFECPFHGWRFDSHGKCTHAPNCNASQSTLSRSRIMDYPVVESAGMVWVCLEQVPQHAVPQFPEHYNAAYRTRNGSAYEWDASFSRCVENLIDVSVFANGNSSGYGAANLNQDRVETWREKSALCFESTVLNKAHVAKKLETLGAVGAACSNVTDTYRVSIPGTVYRRRVVGNGEQCSVLFFAASPINASRTRCFWTYSRNFSLAEEYDDIFLQSELDDLIQRRSIVESQRPKVVSTLGSERQRELLVSHYDTVILHYRNALSEMSRLNSSNNEYWSDCS